MTWDEFKAAVDAKLAEVGADGSVEIFYLDTGNFPTDPFVVVGPEGLSVH